MRAKGRRRRALARGTLAGRLAACVVSAMLVSAGAYAFTASNTVATTTAGNGSNGISGYTVENVSYTLTGAINPGEPEIRKVSFTLVDPNGGTPPAGNVSALVTNSHGSADFDECSEAGTTWTCKSSWGNMLFVSAADMLYVTAAQ
ncbi:MAG: hypothetical protein ACYDEY_13690 [Acidimicrobiales bacterium]